VERTLIILALLTPAACAQTIDPDHASAWGENIGWLNWGDTPASNAPLVHATHLSGFVWGENIGWINLGDGNGPYGNTSDRNFGVNRAANNTLSGFAWGENVGWINFGGGALAAPRNPARVDIAAARLRGYAWGENIGWINLDDNTHFVGIINPPCNGADLAEPFGLLDLQDIIAFVTAFQAQDPIADFVNDGVFDLLDIVAFVTAFNAGCP
jgi:hypothetical protein